MMRYVVFLFAVLSCSISLAKVQTKAVEYKDGDVVLEGFMAWDDAAKSAPGVLIVHQWFGLTDNEKDRAKQLAELGYVAFALDIYGKDVRPANPQAAGAKAGEYKNNRELYRRRLLKGLEVLTAAPNVQKGKIAAIGYCFGGMGVIELARAGAEIVGVVSFHGGLDSPKPEDGKNIKAKVLICHGADDPFVPRMDIEAMKKEFNEANVDWVMIEYSHAVHSFTQKAAGNNNAAGAAYNEKADKRSWQAMQDFFREIFAE
jgi:dienelactone hydrolase